jgi:hypothetical protein
MTRWFEHVGYRLGIAMSVGLTVLIAGFLITVRYAAHRPPAWLSWGGVVGLSLGLLVSLVLLMTAVMRPWRYARDIDTMLAGNSWAHWTYDEAGWKAATQLERRVYTRVIVGMLSLLAVSLLLLLAWLDSDRRNPGLLAFGGLTGAFSLMMLAVIVLFSPIRVLRRSGRGEIYVSGHGVYRRPGGYLSLDPALGVQVDSVDLVDRPRPHVHIVVLVNTNSSATSRHRTLADIPVPRGHEDEARELVARLRSEVVKAPGPRPRPRPRLLD